MKGKIIKCFRQEKLGHKSFNIRQRKRYHSVILRFFQCMSADLPAKAVWQTAGVCCDCNDVIADCMEEKTIPFQKS